MVLGTNRFAVVLQKLRADSSAFREESEVLQLSMGMPPADSTKPEGHWDNLKEYIQPGDAPKRPATEVGPLKGPPDFVEVFFRRGDHSRYAKSGFFAYLEVKGDIDPVKDIYRDVPYGKQSYTLQQLLEKNGMKSPMLSFFLPSRAGGCQPAFHRVERVDWSKSDLQLAPGAAARFQGGSNAHISPACRYTFRENIT
jgi:hypothetical protein